MMGARIIGECGGRAGSLGYCAICGFECDTSAVCHRPVYAGPPSEATLRVPRAVLEKALREAWIRGGHGADHPAGTVGQLVRDDWISGILAELEQA